MSNFLKLFRMTKKQELPKQFDFTTKVKELMHLWADKENIHLIRIEYVVPFVFTDKSVCIYFFIDTDQRVKEYDADGVTQLIKQKFLSILSELNYPKDYLNEVGFVVDSDENVKKNYEGNYFYRLR